MASADAGSKSSKLIAGLFGSRIVWPSLRRSSLSDQQTGSDGTTKKSASLLKLDEAYQRVSETLPALDFRTARRDDLLERLALLTKHRSEAAVALADARAAGDAVELSRHLKSVLSERNAALAAFATLKRELQSLELSCGDGGTFGGTVFMSPEAQSSTHGGSHTYDSPRVQQLTPAAGMPPCVPSPSLDACLPEQSAQGTPHQPTPMYLVAPPFTSPTSELSLCASSSPAASESEYVEPPSTTSTMLQQQEVDAYFAQQQQHIRLLQAQLAVMKTEMECAALRHMCELDEVKLDRERLVALNAAEKKQLGDEAVRAATEIATLRAKVADAQQKLHAAHAENDVLRFENHKLMFEVMEVGELAAAAPSQPPLLPPLQAATTQTLHTRGYRSSGHFSAITGPLTSTLSSYGLGGTFTLERNVSPALSSTSHTRRGSVDTYASDKAGCESGATHATVSIHSRRNSAQLPRPPPRTVSSNGLPDMKDAAKDSRGKDACVSVAQSTPAPTATLRIPDFGFLGLNKRNRASTAPSPLNRLAEGEGDEDSSPTDRRVHAHWSQASTHTHTGARAAPSANTPSGGDVHTPAPLLHIASASVLSVGEGASEVCGHQNGDTGQLDSGLGTCTSVATSASSTATSTPHAPSLSGTSVGVGSSGHSARQPSLLTSALSSFSNFATIKASPSERVAEASAAKDGVPSTPQLTTGSTDTGASGDAAAATGSKAPPRPASSWGMLFGAALRGSTAPPATSVAATATSVQPVASIPPLAPPSIKNAGATVTTSEAPASEANGSATTDCTSRGTTAPPASTTVAPTVPSLSTATSGIGRWFRQFSVSSGTTGPADTARRDSATTGDGRAAIPTTRIRRVASQPALHCDSPRSSSRAVAGRSATLHSLTAAELTQFRSAFTAAFPGVWVPDARLVLKQGRLRSFTPGDVLLQGSSARCNPVQLVLLLEGCCAVTTPRAASSLLPAADTVKTLRPRQTLSRSQLGGDPPAGEAVVVALTHGLCLQFTRIGVAVTCDFRGNVPVGEGGVRAMVVQEQLAASVKAAHNKETLLAALRRYSPLLHHIDVPTNRLKPQMLEDLEQALKDLQREHAVDMNGTHLLLGSALRLQEFLSVLVGTVREAVCGDAAMTAALTALCTTSTHASTHPVGGSSEGVSAPDASLHDELTARDTTCSAPTLAQAQEDVTASVVCDVIIAISRTMTGGDSFTWCHHTFGGSEIVFLAAETATQAATSVDIRGSRIIVRSVNTYKVCPAITAESSEISGSSLDRHLGYWALLRCELREELSSLPQLTTPPPPQPTSEEAAEAVVAASGSSSVASISGRTTPLTGLGVEPEDVSHLRMTSFLGPTATPVTTATKCNTSSSGFEVVGHSAPSLPPVATTGTGLPAEYGQRALAVYSELDIRTTRWMNVTINIAND